MYISKQWLEQFVDIKKVTPEEIARRLTLSTVEVEGIKKLGDGLDGVIVGLVERVLKHPNADKLNVCAVNVGPSASLRSAQGKVKTLQIVCGGSNVRPGMKVALAGIGAKVKWHGEGELVELKPVEIRGIPSEGMICGADEIGLLEMFPKKEEKEIVDLTHLTAKPGTALAVALGLDDVVFEIDNKSLSNRPDLWGHYGIAREVATLFDKPLKPYKTQVIKARGHKNMKPVTLAVDVQDKTLCPRYMAVAIDGIQVGSSPEWLQARLRAAGVRPINVVVDITNYVMMEVGQPMHAFDADRLHENIKASKHESKIVVRRAKEGERLKALDGKEYALSKDMLVIADSEQPVAIAGVMGGEASGVTAATTKIVFESATFDPVSIRKTSTALGLRSESSARFEKGLSPERAEIALRKAVELTLALVPGSFVASAVIDTKATIKKRSPIVIPLELLEKKLGTAIKTSHVKTILSHLGFGVIATKTALKVHVPDWRIKDVNIAEDVIEEIARVAGYDAIPTTLPSFTIVPPRQGQLRGTERRVRELLAYEQGFTEMHNYSFVSREAAEALGLAASAHLELENPVAKDRPLLRRTLKSGLIDNIEQNLHRHSRVACFEIGRIYLSESIEQSLPAQPVMLGLAFAEAGNTVPFTKLSAALTGLSERLRVSLSFEKSDQIAPLYHPGRSAYVVIGGKRVGSIGELHPVVAKRIGIAERVAVAEIALEALTVVADNHRYEPVPLYPPVSRDVAFVVDASVAHDTVVAHIQKLSPLIESVTLFDVFAGGAIPSGKKSMAYRIVYRSPDRTLETKEVETVHNEVVATLERELSADIRK